MIDGIEMIETTVAGSSGAILQCSHTAIDSGKPGLLIALPFGVPATVAHAAFSAFAPGFNVVTWESRFILNLDQDFTGDERLAPAEHVEDMLCLLRALEIDTCHLIGYCSGAGISLLAASLHPEVFSELILVNGEYQLFRKGHASTDYQRSIDTFLPVVASSRRQAGFIFTKMAEISNAKRAGAEPTELDRQINLPFSKEEHLFRYAKNYMAYRDFDALEVAGGVRQPAFVVTGRRDEHSSMENSEAVAGAIGAVKTFVADEGDHYDFCRAGSSTLAEIGAHLGTPFTQ
ncbi:MAG TPA: alpha/beta hydrolase [Thermoanaerobaculia bacterium]|jgi:pimeloyl-ACP methyl ester carboxylesterase